MLSSLPVSLALWDTPALRTAPAYPLPKQGASDPMLANLQKTIGEEPAKQRLRESCRLLPDCCWRPIRTPKSSSKTA